MLSKIIEQIKEIKFERYDDAFNFFLSKPINLIISNSRFDFVVKFKDLEFFDDDVEYLKRYYSIHEIAPRVSKLTQFYEISMPRPITNLIPTDPYPIIQKRERRIIKMMINKEKQLEQREGRIDDTVQEQNELLYDMDQQINSEEDSSSEDDKKSYDSSLHDIYQEFIADQLDEKYEGIIDSQSIKKSNLIIDFKGEPRPKEKITREIIKQRKDIKQQKSKNNFINESQDYRQETLPISMKPTKSRKSFMQYYYSISPQKTNILNSLYKI